MIELAGGLLFDLDGSLIDTAPDMGTALNKLLIENGKAPLSSQQIRPHVSHGSKALVALGFGSALSPATEADLIRRYLSCYARCVADDSALFDGMDTLLKQLEERDVPWGIVTNKPTRYAVPLLRKLSLSERCSALVCGDSMALRKPHPAPILLACQRASLAPTHSIYVGDALRDITAGAAAGMRTALMEWGYFDKGENTDAWGADWHCADADALRQLCKQVGLL